MNVDIPIDHIKTEEQFINLLLTNKDLLLKWLSSNLLAKHFCHQHKYILMGIAWSNGEGVSLTRRSFNNFLETICTDGKKLIPAEISGNMHIYDKISILSVKTDDFPMLLSKIKTNYIQRETVDILNVYKKDRESKSIQEANDILAKNMLVLNNDFDNSVSSYVDLGAYKNEFLKNLNERRNNPTKRIICNIPEIDDTMSVGFKKGTLTIFVAAPGTFKTTMMLNISLNIFKNSNENVLYIPIEGGEDMFFQKLISRETRIPSEKMEKSHLLTDSEVKRIADEYDKWNSLSNRFKVFTPGETVKISTIKNEIESRISYFKPRIVVVDYLDNVSSDTKYNRDDLEIRHKLEELIRIGNKYECAIITAAKLSREAIKRLRDMKDGKQDLDTADVHGGQEYGGNATNLYAQMRNPNQPGSKLDIFCLKTRYGSPIFKNGKNRASLDIKPEIGLIESETEKDSTWNFDQDKDVMSTLNSAPTPIIDNLPSDDDSPF